MSKEGLLLLLDLEGITGFSFEHAPEKNWEYAEREIEGLLRALGDCWREAITICVVHNDGTGFPDRLIRAYGLRLLEGVDRLPEAIEGVGWAFLLGFHGMRNSGGCFDHSFRMDILDLTYGGQHLGEVGIFSRWFLRQAVTPLLVSGEGQFRHELEGIPCLLHTVPGELRDDREIDAVNQALCRTAVRAIQNREALSAPKPVADGPLAVQVDNLDKYALLADCPYLSAEAERFVFPSLEGFIRDLYPFCLRLNQANLQIARENVAFFKRVRESGSEEELRPLLGDYLGRDVETISRLDRKAIADKVGIRYETA